MLYYHNKEWRLFYLGKIKYQSTHFLDVIANEIFFSKFASNASEFRANREIIFPNEKKLYVLSLVYHPLWLRIVAVFPCGTPSLLKYILSVLSYSFRSSESESRGTELMRDPLEPFKGFSLLEIKDTEILIINDK